MDNKDIEKKLQESADRIEVREFSQVWEEIKEDVVPAPVQRKKLPRWLPALATVACGAVVCATAIPLALYYNKSNTLVNTSDIQSSITTESAIQSSPSNDTSEQRYSHDKLLFKDVLIEEFYAELITSQIHLIDVSQYIIRASRLFITTDGIAKGGRLQIADNTETVSMIMELYSNDVDVNKYDEIVYDQNYTVGTTEIEYRLKDSIPEYSVYIYDIKTVHKGTQYFMEYTCGTENIQPFLDGLFQE